MYHGPTPLFTRVTQNPGRRTGVIAFSLTTCFDNAERILAASERRGVLSGATMKRLYLCLALVSLLGACNQAATPPLATPVSTPRSAGGGSAGCPGGLSGAECDAYKDGIKAGVADRVAGQSDSFRRHESEFDPRFQASYRAGYATGWYNNGK